MKTAPVPVSVIASIYHNRLVAPFEDYRAALEHITGQTLALHNIASARKTAAAELERQIPRLKKTPRPPEKTDSGNARAYVKRFATTLGTDEDIAVTSLAKTKFKPRTFTQAYR